MKIAVVGMGYVGLSNAIMLSSKNKVSMYKPGSRPGSLAEVTSVAPTKKSDADDDYDFVQTKTTTEIPATPSLVPKWIWQSSKN